MESARPVWPLTARALPRSLAALVVLCLVGCYSAGDVELLESQLRRNEDALRDYRGRLNQANEELARKDREIDELHRQLASAHESPSTLLPEQIHALAQVEDIAVDTWRTGLIDVDNTGGADELLLVLYPRDSDGQAVKVAGDLEIKALDLTLPEAEQMLGHWTFSADQAAELWHVGFVSIGYHVQVPLRSTPRGTELLLHALLTTADGRAFTVTHALPVRRRANAGEPPLPLESVDRSFEDAASNEHIVPPLSTTSRSVLVPTPPGDSFSVDVDAEAAGFASTLPEDDEPPMPSAGSPPRGTETSDNWTVEAIPAWR